MVRFRRWAVAPEEPGDGSVQDLDTPRFTPEISRVTYVEGFAY